jgi:membrane-bound lytic murein transglycosylase B
MPPASVAIAAALLLAAHPVAAAPSGYAGRAEVRAFAIEMADKHGFEVDALLRLFRQARFLPGVIKAILPPSSPSARSWRAYRARYIEAVRIAEGLRFWQRHADVLAQAQEQFGVPAEIIVAIIGVETVFGRVTGNHQTLSALATLAFDYPPRADLFRRELEELLLLARERERDPLSFTGSYAGALGIPQFLPSSYRRYAVDFDGDGRVDLAVSERDAIGSVANFLLQHGWQAGGMVALPALAVGDGGWKIFADGAVEPRFTPSELAEHGISAEREIAADEKCAVIDLTTPNDATEYWLGFRNFYVLTRYNRSSFYAMAVYQLGQELRTAWDSQLAEQRQ